MSIIIDLALFPHLAQLHAVRAYPAELATYLWASDSSVTNAFQLATSFTANLTRDGLDITWHGFKAMNRRLPAFYAIELSAVQTANPVSLYNIAAVGNTTDVDLLVTDANGNTTDANGMLLGNALFEDRLPVELVMGGTKTGFYEANKAHWIPDNLYSGAHCTTEMVLDLTAAGFQAQPVILWAVSYRHGRYGSRPDAGFAIPIVQFAAAALVLDDDGPPGDPAPGGEN